MAAITGPASLYDADVTRYKREFQQNGDGDWHWQSVRVANKLSFLLCFKITEMHRQAGEELLYLYTLIINNRHSIDRKR
jgi:hypothetical protein